MFIGVVKREFFLKYLLLSRQETTAFAQDVFNQLNELWKEICTRTKHEDTISMSRVCLLIVVSRFHS